MQRVERVEELLLEAFLALDELDVVDEQHVDLAVAPFEVNRRVLPDGVDELVEERLGGDVTNGEVWVVRVDVAGDRPKQVRLAQPCVPVDEQRVVRLGWSFGHGQRGRVGESIARARDEVVEGVAILASIESIAWRLGGDRLCCLGGGQVWKVNLDPRLLGSEIQCC